MAQITTEELYFAFKQSDNVELLRQAIQYGISIDAPYMGGTILAMASYHGRIESVRLLLEHNADPNKNGWFGESPLKKAVMNSKLSNLECIRLLIDAGANIDYSSPNGTNVLMHSARIGKLDYVQCLLEAGADPLVVDWRGKTASMMARENGHLEVADFIDNYGEPVKCALEIEEY